MALIPVADAQARLLAGVVPLELELVPIDQAAGRTLASDVRALRTQPPFSASAMDGYAVRAADLAPGAVLTVIGEAAAGHGFSGTCGPGQAVRIFTGAPVPDSADTILIQENATRFGDSVTVNEPEKRGRYVRPAGLDFAAGSVLLHAGQRLGPREIGLAAAMNHASLPVRRRPKVAILATGDELVAPGSNAGPDQIVASNQLALAALVRDLGGEAIPLGIAPDDMDDIRARIREGLNAAADVICLLGGASVGDHDYTRAALEAEGMALDLWKIAMRPGKPLMFGRLGSGRALGLPGNPVSSIVCGYLFLAPLLRALLGEQSVLPPEETATLARPLAANDQRQDYLRARLETKEGRLIADPFELQDSSVLSLLAAAHALVIREPHAPAAGAGETVRIIRL